MNALVSITLEMGFIGSGYIIKKCAEAKAPARLDSIARKATFTLGRPRISTLLYVKTCASAWRRCASHRSGQVCRGIVFILLPLTCDGMLT